MSTSARQSTEPNPKASPLMRFLAGKNVPPDARSVETKYEHMKAVTPIMLGFAITLTFMIGYLVGSISTH